MNTQFTEQAPETPAPAYEAPAIESVLTSADLEREVHYAGAAPVSGPTPTATGTITPA